MSTGWVGPRLAAQPLAALDPALAHLEEALAHVGAVGGDVDDVRWSPGRGCRLAYRTATPSGGCTYRDLRVGPGGWTERDYLADSSMPGLQQAADPATAAERLEGILGRATWSVRPVRYRGGARCVLRLDADTQAGPARVYAKVLTDQAFGVAAPALVALSRAPALAGVVPHLLAVWPDLRVVLAAEVAGSSASSLLGRAAPASSSQDLGRALGVLLWRLHRQPSCQVPEVSGAQCLRTVSAELAALRRADPVLGRRCAEVITRLGTQPPPGPDVCALVHGAFRPGQVVVGPDGGLTVLDLDGVCRGAPERDLASALAHLAWMRRRDPEPRVGLQSVGASLVAGYREAGGHVVEPSLRWWSALALVQVVARRFRRLETPSWPLTAGLVDEAEALAPPSTRAWGQLGRATATSSPARVPQSPVDLLDAQQMSRVLAEVLVPPGAVRPRLVVESADQLSVAAGRRVVVRYVVRGLDRSGPSTLVAKAFAEAPRARLLHEHLRALSQGPFSGSRLGVPEPLGLLPDPGVVFYRAAAGTPLDRATGRPDVLRGVRGAAAWLARLHTSDVVLPRAWSLAQERENSRGWAEVVGQAYPHLGRAADRIAVRWADGLDGATGGQVPVHKDFHPGHVLVGDDICVIDLDEARQGDPELDVAHFCAYLEAFGPERSDVRLAHAFMTEYAAGSGRQPGSSAAAYAAYSWLKIARQWTDASGPCRGAGEAERRAGAARALTRGLAWLGE